jgi:hypothetical protein
LFRAAAPEQFEAAKKKGLLPALSARREESRREEPEDDESEHAPGYTIPDIDPENRVGKGRGTEG